MHFNAMFDRIEHPARGRDGGENGAPGAVLLDDGTRLAARDASMCRRAAG